MSKKVATVTVSEHSQNCEALVTAVLSRGSRGHLGEICRVTGPVARRSDVIWRATMEGLDRGFEVRESPPPVDATRRGGATITTIRLRGEQ